MKEAEALSGLVEICLFIVPSFLLRLRRDNADKLLFSSGFEQQRDQIDEPLDFLHEA